MKFRRSAPWIVIGVVVVAAGVTATVGASSSTSASESSSSANARQLADIALRTIKVGFALHRPGSDDVFLVKGQDMAWYRLAHPEGAGVPALPPSVRPFQVFIGCNSWSRQSDGTYIQTIGSGSSGGHVLVGGDNGIPGEIGLIAELDSHSSGTIVTVRKSIARSVFNVRQDSPHLGPSSKMEATVEGGHLRNVHYWVSGSPYGTYQYSLDLDKFGQVQIVAPPSDEISHSRTTSGVCAAT